MSVPVSVRCRYECMMGPVEGLSVIREFGSAVGWSRARLGRRRRGSRGL